MDKLRENDVNKKGLNSDMANARDEWKKPDTT